MERNKIESRVPIQTDRVIELKKEEVSLWDSILIPGNDALDQIFVTFAYCYAIQNSSKNSAEKWVQKVQSSSSLPSFLTLLFFLGEFHTAARFRWKCEP